MQQPHIVIIGAGLAGLAACLEVERQGGRATLIEQDETIGGRVQTDSVEGFLLDRGFQVLLSSYPSIQTLDLLPSLHTHPFYSGAICHTGEDSYSLVNPVKHPALFIQHAHKIPRSLYLDGCKLLKGLLLNSDKKCSTAAFLDRCGISKQTQEAFLQPFFGGVFLDTKLEARASMFDQYSKLFMKGWATLPEKGMRALPEELFARLENTYLLLKSRVQEIKGTTLHLADSQQLSADAIILAVDAHSLKNWTEDIEVVSRSVSCFYFSLPRGRIDDSPFLHLGADGPVTNLAVLNHIQPSYAPEGWDLLSATVVPSEWQERDDLLHQVKETISRWFRVDVNELHHLRTYRIKHALPSQISAPPLKGEIAMKGFEKVFLAGEAVETPSIDGALRSGKQAAAAAIQAVR